MPSICQSRRRPGDYSSDPPLLSLRRHKCRLARSYRAPCTARLKLLACATDRRSEEHTFELQSRQYLVCRLLLEKKKTPPATDPHSCETGPARAAAAPP